MALKRQPHSLLSPARAACLALAGGLLINGLTGCTTWISPADQPGPLSPDWVRLTRPGPYADRVQVQIHTLISAYGCELTYAMHRPADPPKDTATVILAHGFQRSRDTLRGWAAHWAGHGVPSVAVDLCNSTWLAGHHDRNAEDLQAIANARQVTRRLYAGFSAGGLTALLAAEQDPAAIATLALDPVTTRRFAERLQGPQSPRLLLFGQPSLCNAGNRALAALQPATPEPSHGLAHELILRIPHTSHCQFEWPQDNGCARLCGQAQPLELARQHTLTLRAVATHWVLRQARGNERPPAMQQAWLERLEQAGRVVSLKP